MKKVETIIYVLIAALSVIEATAQAILTDFWIAPALFILIALFAAYEAFEINLKKA